jgi:hypothetical protein
MRPFCSVSEWREAFGSAYDDSVFELVDTHQLFLIQDDQVFFRLDLKVLFDEVFDLYSVDPKMVDDTVQLGMVFADQELNPDVLTNLLDLASDKLGYEPIDNTGAFVLKVKDVRQYYGEGEFDTEMKQLYPKYEEWTM